MADTGTSRPGAIQPGSPEAQQEVAEHLAELQAADRARRLADEYAENESPAGRSARALEDIALTLRRIEEALRR